MALNCHLWPSVALYDLKQPCVTLYDLMWPCMIFCSLVLSFVALSGLAICNNVALQFTSTFLVVIDPKLFGLVCPQHSFKITNI